MYSGDFQRCLENLVRLDLGKNDQLANREGKQGDERDFLLNVEDKSRGQHSCKRGRLLSEELGNVCK